MPSAPNAKIHEPPEPFELNSLLAVWKPASRRLNFCGQCGNPLSTAVIDRRERQVCSAACGYIVWDHPVPVVAAILQLNAEVVVLVRNRGWPEGLLRPWSFAAGLALQDWLNERNSG